jgi:hypothetical protein
MQVNRGDLTEHRSNDAGMTRAVGRNTFRLFCCTAMRLSRRTIQIEANVSVETLQANFASPVTFTSPVTDA